eukprot:CAMPEP_0170616004 /NCGR_PEP_ID=MMETSP0224-20130122/25642_1 /TAXON_ID=285029 /ORGANISM="Togula jolla, Strain CCCM 725" /LENGTH=185 /DNA_ID=CAMNT_0010941779 /DNA_START=39 /DNA_END=596 /DNA_ORIENTATION=+
MVACMPSGEGLHDPQGAATWRDVAEALAHLESKQSAVRKELFTLRSVACKRLEQARGALELRDEELASVRAAKAAAAVEFTRQQQKLAWRLADSTHEARRAKRSALASKARLCQERSELRDGQVELRSAKSALDAQNQENARLRARMAELEKRLDQGAAEAAAAQSLVRKQAALLDEAAAALQPL